MIPDEVVRMIFPKDRAGSNKLTQFSTTHLAKAQNTAERGRLTGIDTDVESGRDDTSLIQSTVKLDDDLSTSVVVDDLELSDVTYSISLYPHITRSCRKGRMDDFGTSV